MNRRWSLAVVVVGVLVADLKVRLYTLRVKGCVLSVGVYCVEGFRPA